MNYQRFGRQEKADNDEGRLLGRVRCYSERAGFGFVNTSTAKDIMLSSYDLKGIEKQISIGTTISFIPEERKGHIVAADIIIVDNSRFYNIIEIPGGCNFAVKKLEKIDYRKGSCILEKLNMTEDDLKEMGVSLDSLCFMYIKERKGYEHFFLEKGSPRFRCFEYIDGVEDVYRNIEKEYFIIAESEKS